MISDKRLIQLNSYGLTARQIASRVALSVPHVHARLAILRSEGKLRMRSNPHILEPRSVTDKMIGVYIMLKVFAGVNL